MADTPFDSEPIAPGLLLAMPQLGDPNFSHSVVLLIEHSSERGSFGLIVNRPTDVRIADAMREIGEDWPEESDAVLWNGGPVSPGPYEPAGLILHYPVLPDDDPDRAGIVLHPFPPPEETLPRLAGESIERLRVMIGYAGWGSRQLEAEIRHGAWLLAPADPALIFGTPAEDMWQAAIRSLGIEPGALMTPEGLH